MKKYMSIGKSAWWLLLSIVSAGSMAYYTTQIWSANQPPHFNDLYAPWWGAHELLLHGRNPYSPEVAHEIQAVIYGAPTSPSTEDPMGMGGGFAYPPYAALLLWPTVHLSFSAAERTFWVVSALLTLFSLTLWLRTLHFTLPPAQWLTVALFTAGSFPVLQAFQLQNLSLIAAALITIFVFLLSSDRLILAGIVLAASTFKPQFTVALIPWIALWTLGDWKGRRPVAWSFLATMLVLDLTSEWMVSRWAVSFLGVVRAYRHYTYGHSVLDVWFTPAWGAIIAGAMLLAGLVFGWKYRLERAGSMNFIIVTSIVLAATLVVIPTLAPHAQLLLLPGILCLVQRRSQLASSPTLLRLAQAAVWTLLGWPSFAAVALLLAATVLPPQRLLQFWEFPLYTSPVLPLAVLLGLGCLLLTTSLVDAEKFRSSRFTP